MINRKFAVLVVEDNDLIRLAMTSALSDGDFEVFEADCALDAISMLQNNSELEAMFMNIEMPGAMRGLALAETARHNWPPLKIIVTSGGPRPLNEALPETVRFLGKPYDPDVVISTLLEWHSRDQCCG